jgi:hypothetical protein
MKMSYRAAPKVQPKKGATIGIWKQLLANFIKTADLTHPEVVSASRPNFSTISDCIRHQSGAKITSNIDCVAGFPTKARTEAEDEKEETQREPFVTLFTVSVVRTTGKRTRAFGTPLLLGSFSAKMTNISNALAMNSEKNWLVFPRNGCGYVQKMAAVAFSAGGTVRRPPSK